MIAPVSWRSRASPSISTDTFHSAMVIAEPNQGSGFNHYAERSVRIKLSLAPARGKAQALFCPLGQLFIILGYRQHDTTRISVCCSLSHDARFLGAIPPKLRGIQIRCHAMPINDLISARE